MSEFNIEVQGGSSVRLPTAGKYCEKDIIVTAIGGGTEEIENIIDESGVLGTTDGTVEDKVEALIDKAKWEDVWYKQSEKFANTTSMFNRLQAETLPRTNLIGTQQCGSLCEGALISYIDYYMNTADCKNFNDAFRNTSNLKKMVGVNTAKATTIVRLYQGSSIEEIDEPFNFSSIQNANAQANAFNAPYLVKVSFVEETIKFSIAFTSPYLSAESIQSIIDGLAYVEMAQTLTLHADVKAKLTNDQLTTITNKNWTLA